jgi:phosphatidylinositol alpha-1,6-mannosyltransferase
MKDTHSDPIWIFTVAYPGQDGGIAVYAHEVARALHRRGESVLVIAGTVDPADAALDNGSPFKVIRFPRVRSKIRNLFFRYRSFLEAWRAAPPRFVMATEWFSTGIVVWTLSFFLPISYVVITHGNEILRCKHQPLLRWLLRRVLGRAEGVFSVSRYTQRLVEKLVPEIEAVFIPNGVSMESVRTNRGPEQLRAELGLEDQPIILSLGRLVQRKGHDMLLKAMPAILEAVPNAVWLIAGQGPYQATLQADVESMGLDDHVRWLGYIESRDKGDYYRMCDVYALVSRTIETEGEVEGFGITYLEASACRAPIVAGRSGGVEDAVQDGITGLLVDPRDPDAIAAAVIRLLCKREYAQQLGEQGYQRTLKDFSWDGYIEQLMASLPQQLRN